MFVKSVVWSAASQAREKATAETAKGRRLDAAFRVLAAMPPIQEYKQIYTEWERGEREIRIDSGFIMMCFTPTGQPDNREQHRFYQCVGRCSINLVDGLADRLIGTTRDGAR
jgi:hypothetical protein